MGSMCCCFFTCISEKNINHKSPTKTLQEGPNTSNIPKDTFKWVLYWQLLGLNLFQPVRIQPLPSASQGGVNGGGDTVETVEHGPTNQAPSMRKALPLPYADIILRPFLKFNNPITSGNVPSVALPGYIKFPAVRH